MKKILISLMLILPAWLLPVSMARAVVPTVDATVLVQAIVLEITGLLNLSEEATAVATQYQELAQQYTTYEDYVNQMSTIDFSMGGFGTDLFSNVAKGYGSGETDQDAFYILSSEEDNNVTEHERRTILKEHGFGVKTEQEMKNEYEVAGFAAASVDLVEEKMESINLGYDKYAGQVARVKVNREEVDKLEKRNDRTESKVSGLGEEDHVKALKIIAGQQMLGQEHMQLLATIANQQLLAYEPPSVTRAKAKEQALQSIKDAQERHKARFAQPLYKVPGNGWNM